MAVSSETYKSGPYGGNGLATVFAYQFRILDETHLKVIRTDASGLETPLSLGVHYTVSGVGCRQRLQVDVRSGAGPRRC